MIEHLVAEGGKDSIAILPVAIGNFNSWRAKQATHRRNWLAASGFRPESGASMTLPKKDGTVDCILFCTDAADPWCWAQLPPRLPAGIYHIDKSLDAAAANWAALAWALGCYSFDRYRSGSRRENPRLVWPVKADRDPVANAVAGTILARDLINAPAGDMGPAELEAAATALAGQTGAKIRVIVGDRLETENYPMIHAVGRASPRAPRLIDLTWGKASAPKVTLVGKGVCFDTGGLDMKNSAAMKIMKKDMGGSAIVLALAAMIMAAKLPVRLRVLIPAVDNAISGNAFRPLDVLHSRKGLTVEIGNTDAEGRLVLADALTEADSESPDLLIDIATLTGAARVALGPEIPPFFTPDDELAAELSAAAESEADPLWRLPLWKPYRRLIDSKVADLSNASDSPHAGAITAALFLQEFVAPTTLWAHFDVYGWNAATRPGRPEGGEATALRAIYAVIAKRFGKK